MSSIRDRWIGTEPVRRVLWYRAKLAVGSYMRLVGICLLAGGAIVTAIWTWVVVLAYVHPWPF